MQFDLAPSFNALCRMCIKGSDCNFQLVYKYHIGLIHLLHQEPTYSILIRRKIKTINWKMYRMKTANLIIILVQV